MTSERIAELVAERNKSYEEGAAYDAARLIDRIAAEQRAVREAVETGNMKIAEYRKQLAELTVETVSVADILGEGSVE